MEPAQFFQTLGLNHDQIDTYLKDYGVRFDQLLTGDQLTGETADLVTRAVAKKKTLLSHAERASLHSLLHKAKTTASAGFSPVPVRQAANKNQGSRHQLDDLSNLLPNPNINPANPNPKPAEHRTFRPPDPKSANHKEEQDRELGVVKFISEDSKHGYIVPMENGKFPDLADKDKGVFFYLNECEGQVQKGMLVKYETTKMRTGRINATAVKTSHPIVVLHDEKGWPSVKILKKGLSQHSFEVRSQVPGGLAYANLFYKPGTQRLSVKITESNIPISKKIHDGLVHVIFTSLAEHQHHQINPLLGILVTNDNFLQHSIGIVKRIQQYWRERPLAELFTDLAVWKPWPMRYFRETEASGAALDNFILAGWLCGLFSYQASFDPNDADTKSYFEQLTPEQLDLLLEAGLRDHMEKHLLEWLMQIRIRQGFKLRNDAELAATEQSLNSWQQAGLFQHIPEECLQGNISYRVKLWDEGFIAKLDPDTVKQQLSLLPFADQGPFLQRQPPEVLRALSDHPMVANYCQQQASEKIAGFLNESRALCIDLEGDQNRLDEIAWTTHENTIGYPEQFNIKDLAFSELRQTLKSNPLVTGHHILHHDLPIIASHGVAVNSELVWDTILLEWFLCPWRTSFGLVTQHSAAADAKLTFELFQNQLARLALRSKQDAASFEHLLPIRFRPALKRLFTEDCWSNLKAAPFEQAAQRFFRPQKQVSAVPPAVEKAIHALPDNSLIIAPKILWPALARRFPVVFHSVTHPFALILNSDRVKAALTQDDPALAAVLQFICCEEAQQRLPYWGALPMMLQLAIGQDRASRLCRNSQTHTISGDEKHAVAIEEIDYYLHGSAMGLPARVLVLARSLALTQNKLLLGEIDYAFLFERLKRESTWMQLAGGQNIIPLSREQCEKLSLQVPEAAISCRVEKGREARLKVYCTIDLNTQLAELQSQITTDAAWEYTIPSKAVFLVKPDKKISGYAADQKRVNPESLYRAAYWAYQLQLVKGLQSARPLVWLIQDAGEVSSLIASARKQGYYVPDERAALARQLELLHQSKGQRLLITAIDRWTELLDLNYEGALDYAWDSFKLYEQPLVQTEETGIGADDEVTLTDDEAIIEDRDHQIFAPRKVQDLFALIEMQKPLIDHFAARTTEEGGRLLLLDSRLADYFGLADKWQVNTALVPLWKNEAHYQQQLEEQRIFFPGPVDLSNLQLNLQDAQDILRYIFLDVNQGQDWYKYQALHLDHILPAEKDLLISLPTGAGKSLLFQGPALFRSGFTNRLSLVITPLRALMEDQVSALWERGFISNVEFISGDRSSVEMSDIYRRIAGGEITLLYLTPERFRSRAFENALLARMGADSGLEFVVFDEAHCISQWGQEFRPDYLSASRKLAGLLQMPETSGKMLLFSATVSDQVFEDIKQILA